MGRERHFLVYLGMVPVYSCFLGINVSYTLLPSGIHPGLHNKIYIAPNMVELRGKLTVSHVSENLHKGLEEVPPLN